MTDQERRKTAERRSPEDRVVGTLEALQRIGLNPASVVLILFCAAIVWWALIWQPANDTSQQYSRQMIGLVTNIQNELQDKNKHDSEFRGKLMIILDRHTQEINTMHTLLISLGYWPIEQLDNGNFQFQPPSVRSQLSGD